MLVNIWNTTFLYPFGPFAVLIIYHLTGFIILVLPENFEENVVKKGIVDTIRNTLLEELCQQGHKNLPGYIQLKRVLTTCMFMVFNWKFWTICRFVLCNCIKFWIACIFMVFNWNFWFTCMFIVFNYKFWTTVMLLIFLPVLSIPVFLSHLLFSLVIQ